MLVDVYDVSPDGTPISVRIPDSENDHSLLVTEMGTASNVVGFFGAVEAVKELRWSRPGVEADRRRFADVASRRAALGVAGGRLRF